MKTKGRMQNAECRMQNVEKRLLPNSSFFVLHSAFCILFFGCSFFSRTKNQIYSLDPVPGTGVAAGFSQPIGIDSVELPPGFDRKEVVVRKANNQLDARATQQWSATLAPLVLHTLAFDLASRLPAGMVILPGDARPAATRSINVVFEEIAAGPDAKVTIDAVWDRTHHEHLEVPITSLDSANIASGMSQALSALADRMVAGLR